MDSPIDIRQIPQAVCQILEQLDRSGYETWLVGGCVRDLCLGLVPKDYDLATNALPEQVQAVFTRSFATGLQHGTVTVVWQDLAVEITTFRSEGSYSDARRPDAVVFQNAIEADLARRDFTMNSLAWRPDRGLLDLHEGLADLQQGLLRTVGDPTARFGEDALRLLRAVRFAVTYDLTPDPDLVSAAANKADQLDRLSRERLVSEMLRILNAPYATQLSSFRGCGILGEVAAILFNIATDDRRLCDNLSRLIDADLPPAARLPLFYLAAAAPDLSPMALRRLLLPSFQASTGHALQHLLMQQCRVSRHLAHDGEAMLYGITLRLLLPLNRPLNNAEQRMLLRLLARRSHLAGGDLAAVATGISRLLQLCLGADLPAGPENKFAFAGSSGQRPLVLAELALNGRQLHLAGWPTGPAMRVLLERLLSRVCNEPALNRPADLLCLAWSLDPPAKYRLTNN